MFENLFLGIVAIGANIEFLFTVFILNPIVLGFILGFAVASGIHLIAINERPHYIPCILTKSPKESFRCLVPKNKKGGYLITYSKFLKRYNRVRIFFYGALFVFLLLVTITLIKF